MYYAIFDLDTKDNLATGLNSTTKEDVAEAYISYKSIDTDVDLLRKEISLLGIECVLKEDNFQLDESETPFDDYE